MRLKLLTMMAGLVATVVCAQDNYLSRSASGTTSAVTTFPGRPGQSLRLVNLDVTSDLSSSVVSWAVGTAGANLAVASTAAATNVFVYGSALASNDVVLAQSAAGSVTNATVWGRTSFTNGNVFLGTVIGTNLAAGDTVRERISTAYAMMTGASSSATDYLISSTNGIAVNDIVIGETTTTNGTGTVSAIDCVTNKVVPLLGSVKIPLAVGDSVYERGTVKTNIAGTISASSTNLHVLGTNGFAASDVVVIETAGQNMVVRTIHSVDTTNIALTATVGIALAADDLVHRLGTAKLIKFPATEGDRFIILNNATSLVSNDVVVAVPASGAVWRDAVGATDIGNTNVNTLTLASTLAFGMPMGANFYKLTNSYSVTLATSSNATSVVLTNSTGLAAGDVIVFSPAGTGTFKNTVLGAEVITFNRINFTGAVGLALGVGDDLFTQGTAVTAPIGATTVRNAADGSFVAPAGRPARLTLNGTSACSINNAVGKYGP